MDNQVTGYAYSVGSKLTKDRIVGSGVISDLFPIEKRGAAFGKYFFGVFIGPLTGPILGIYKSVVQGKEVIGINVVVAYY